MKLRIEYWLSQANHQWYFHVKARNGKIVAQSEGYKRFRSCEKTTELFKSAITDCEFIPKEQANDPESVYFRT